MRTATLTVVTGADGATAPSETTVTPDKPWIIGRSRGADIVIDDDRVSRRHLVVERDADAWLVRDVSSNGSWFAGGRIDGPGVPVPSGGELRINLGNPAGPEVVITDDSGADQDELPTVFPDSTAGRPRLDKDAAVPGPRQPDPRGQQVRSGPPDPAQTGLGPVLAAERAGTGAQPTAGAPRKHRGRRLGIVLLVLVLLLVVADRVAARVAAKEAVSQVVQQSQGLTSKPTVKFGGFPFLTQVVFGKYTDIGVGMDDITAKGAPRIEHISGHLKGARIPLSKAIHNNVTKIPVDHVSGTVDMRFADLNAFLKTQPGHLVLGSDNGALQVSGTVEEDGKTVGVTGSGKLAANGSGLTITPTNLHVTNGGDVGDALNGLNDIVGGALSLFPAVPVPLPNLPFHFRLTSVHIGADGLEASAAADKLVLDAQQT